MSADQQPVTSDDKSLRTDDASSIDQDAAQLASFGYKTQLARRWKTAESFAVSFCAMNFIGGTRSILYLGVLAGGPAAAWSASSP